MQPYLLHRRTFLAYTGLLATASLLPFSGCGSRPFRFGLVTDTHYADRAPAGTRFYREAKDKLAECVNRMRQERADFLVHLGDFKDQDDPPQEAKTLRYLQQLEEVYQQFGGATYHVLGNHDMDSISKAQFQERVTNTGIAPLHTYYSFERGGLHFVVLDANFRSDGQPYDRGNFEWTDANLPTEQLAWLEADLAQTNLPAVVFVHQALDGAGDHFINNAPDARQILERSGKTLAVFQGHMHQERYSNIGGIHYCTLLAVVDGEGPANNSYSLVEVGPDGLTLNGYRRAGQHELPT